MNVECRVFINSHCTYSLCYIFWVIITTIVIMNYIKIQINYCTAIVLQNSYLTWWFTEIRTVQCRPTVRPSCKDYFKKTRSSATAEIARVVPINHILSKTRYPWLHFCCWHCGPIWSCTMLNWMRQWDGSKVSDSWQQSRTFLWLPVFSNNSTVKCQERSSWVLQMRYNDLVVRGVVADRTSPRTQLGSLQRSPDPIAGGEMAGCPSPRTPPRSRPFGPRTSWPSSTRFTPQVEILNTPMLPHSVK